MYSAKVAARLVGPTDKTARPTGVENGNQHFSRNESRATTQSIIPNLQWRLLVYVSAPVTPPRHWSWFGIGFRGALGCSAIPGVVVDALGPLLEGSRRGLVGDSGHRGVSGTDAIRGACRAPYQSRRVVFLSNWTVKACYKTVGERQRAIPYGQRAAAWTGARGRSHSAHRDGLRRAYTAGSGTVDGTRRIFLQHESQCIYYFLEIFSSL